MKSNTCTVCFKEGETHLHHIVPKKQGGPDTFNNLIELCLTCHAKAHFERAHWMKRQRSGIEKAKAEGKYKGRKPSFTLQQVNLIMQKFEEGTGVMQISREMDMKKDVVSRITRYPDKAKDRLLKHGLHKED
jgi:hypothetical protein